jgi:DNA-binding response OmpR family regulator
MTLDYGAAAREAAADADRYSGVMPRARVLVVEDDVSIAALLCRELKGLGHTVDSVGLAEDALLAARANDYALIMVDLGLPDGDGLDLVREMRRRSLDAPILMLTARRRVEDRVVGLSSGADDYLVKPFAIPELRARVAALLRRPSRLRPARIAVANVIVDDDALEAMVDGVSLALPRKQLQLLALLVRRKNHMTPKRLIEEALYGFDDEVSANSIEAQVSKLRRALGAAGAKVALETRRGIGYRLVGLDVAPN